MITRILLAIDDSPDSLAAARLATALAGALGARLRIVHVNVDGEVNAALKVASGSASAGARRGRGVAALLERVSSQAGTAGVLVETELLTGEVAATVLRDARTWAADLVVVGKSARSVTGDPYVGTQTRHVLEFADGPVLVVPPPRRQRP